MQANPENPPYKIALAALGNGDATAVQAQRAKIDWPQFMQALSATQFEHVSDIFVSDPYHQNNVVNIKAAATALMTLALEDGFKEFFEVKDSDAGGTSFVQPIFEFIEAGFAEGIRIYMEAGFDPESVYGTDGLNAIDIASEQGKPELVHLMKTHLNKRAAQKAMNEVSGTEGASIKTSKGSAP